MSPLRAFIDLPEQMQGLTAQAAMPLKKLSRSLLDISATLRTMSLKR
jgi:hypothetical protein